MRLFKLRNGNGQEWDLMREDGFFHAPEGLGYAKQREYIRSGFFYLPTEDILEQKAPAGEMIFKTYAAFREFVIFTASEPLTLLYKPVDRWYQMRVGVANLEKTELSEEKRLICPIAFEAQTTWFERVIFEAGLVSGMIKRYDYSYIYKYSNVPSGTIQIRNGAVKSPCRLAIFGEARNPSWTLKQEGIEVMSGKILATIEDGSYLMISADPENMEIATYDRLSGARIGSLYGYSDFSTARFVTAPPGESELTFSDDDARVLEGYVEMERLCYAV